jgi:hypothetical protein
MKFLTSAASASTRWRLRTSLPNQAAASLALAGAMAFAALPAKAAPLPVTGGTTAVKLTSAPTLTGAGVSVSGLGSVALSPGSDNLPIAYFPITGGSLDTGSFAGTIAHNGSGLRLSTSTGSINLTNFLIDTSALSLTGNVAFGSTSLSGVPLFDLSFGSNPIFPFNLKLTATAAGALSTVLGVPNLTGATIGIANTLPITSAIPELATASSMLAGLGLMAWVLGRRRPLALSAKV